MERFPELASVSISNLNPTGFSLGHRDQYLFPKDLSASLFFFLFIHSSFLYLCMLKKFQNCNDKNLTGDDSDF